ncbi:MAG: phosphoglucomutase [Treponemataceae bacterium]|nr:phosphoglucomutase [Treponemataceae bacterium]
MNYTKEQINDCLSHLILSASGWRGVFAKSGLEQDFTTEISDIHAAVSAMAAYSFVQWLSKKCPKNDGSKYTIALATDTRPTGNAIVKAMVNVFYGCGIKVNYIGVASAPEIMAYSRNLDAFVYISASHNPVGHNGIKFGLNDGGVIDGNDAKDLIALFKANCSNQKVIDKICNANYEAYANDIKKIFASREVNKGDCIYSYMEFSKQVISASTDKAVQSAIFNSIIERNVKNPVSIACDFNGSARTLSIDKEIFKQNKIPFYSINDEPFKIVHEIIPEPENLVHVAHFMEKLHEAGDSTVKIGYMPDCDGDRGNVVYWDGSSAQILKAQEVFSLSVLAELSYMDYLSQKFPQFKTEKIALAVNDPTSMRIEEIARVFSAKVFRSEVGEANVVNLARKLRTQGYQVRILGEGSNGGTITHPSCVRDPINTVFALLKLLCLQDEVLPNGKTVYGLFHRWCILSNQESSYKDDFSLSDIVKTLPVYTTTGVSESRAVLHVKTANHGKLKGEYQELFLCCWNKNREAFKKYGIVSWRAFSNNGTEQTDDIQDFSLSARGGLKIQFYDAMNYPIAFIWMRGSGTEPVFRVMADVKGDNAELEKKLLKWHSDIIANADENASKL